MDDYKDQNQEHTDQAPYQEAGEKQKAPAPETGAPKPPYPNQPYPQGYPQQNYNPYYNQNPYGQPPYGQNSYGQPPYGQNPYGQPQKKRNNLALASMIVSIFALLSCCVPFIQFPLAVVAIVLVILSKKGQPLHGFAIAGLVLSILSIVISIAAVFYYGAVFQLMSDPEFMAIYEDMMKIYE